MLGQLLEDQSNKVQIPVIILLINNMMNCCYAFNNSQ